jgi:TfoX/Sxy family transcriptional regulator of competence genes
MPYNKALAERIRRALTSRRDIEEKKMFGGVAFMLGGKMFCGIVGDDLMVRVGPGRYEECLSIAHVRPMDFSGKPMRGYVFVDPQGCKTAGALAKWIGRGVEFVSSREECSTEAT